MHVATSPDARLVIPPGQEAVILRMLDVPAELVGGWKFERATIAEDSIDGFYRGRDGARARVILRTKGDAPAGWRRTEHFALGLAADPPGKPALALYRAVLATVRRQEAAFAWRETALPLGAAADAGPAPAAAHDDAAPRGAAADDRARRARAAEGELDLHLDHTPFVELDVDFDHAGAFAEALALADRFVTYQSDPTYGVQGWRGLALQALDGDASRVATTDDDAGVYQDQSRYRLTEVAALCPITMALLEELIDFQQCRTVSFLMLEPGARITVHIDGEGPPVIRSVNVALNMPAGCRLVIDCNADGSDNSYTRTVPFRDGSAFLLNVGKYHYAVNDSDTPRIHVVVRGSLRRSALDLLARAEAQDGMRGADTVAAALDVKRRALGGEASPAAAAAAPEPAGPALSPFVTTLADEASRRLLAGLELSDRALAARVGQACGRPDDWQIEVDLRLPSGDVATLDFEAAAADRPAWCRTTHLACSYRVDGPDPVADPRNGELFRDLRERLNRFDPPGLANPPAPVAELFAALDRYRPFLSVQDTDYRILFRGAADPVGILWLGFHCNQDCRMCWQGRDWPAPPEAMFDQWIDELCAAGVSSLIFSGGEPTLHPRLPEWLRRAAGANVPVTLETNAIRFNEPGFLDQLRDAGLNGVVVSVHAADAATSDALTMTPDSFGLTVSGTRVALAAGLDVGVHCVVERGNVEGLEDHARFSAELAANGKTVTHVTYSFPIGYHRRELYRDAIAPLDDLRPRLSAAVRLLRAQGIHVSFLGTSGFTPCAFDAPASLLPILPEAVSDDLREGRTFVEACRKCSLQARCLGLHAAYVERHGERGVEPVGYPPAADDVRP